MVTQSLDDSLQPPAADSGSIPAAGRCQPPADLRQQVRQYDERAAVGTWSGPRYRMIHRTLGQGPALIWLPGIAATYRTYALVLNRLAEGFRTIQYEYPGDREGDGARLGRITHDHLVDDLIGLMDHLDIGRAHLAGISFGSTIALKALEHAPERFSRTVVQGAFAHRRFTAAERLALFLGRRVPGTAARLPLRETILAYNSKMDFPRIIEDRWPFYLEENGQTQIRAGSSCLVGCPARPAAQPGTNQRGNPAGSGTGRPDCAASLFRGAESGAAAFRKCSHAHGRPHSPHHARRVAGQADRRLAADLRAGKLHP